MIRYITQDEVYSNIDILKTKTITTTCYSSCTIIYHLLVLWIKAGDRVGDGYIFSYVLASATTNYDALQPAHILMFR